MFGEDIGLAMIHYSISGLAFTLITQLEMIIGLAGFLPFVIINPITVAVYRKEYLEIWSDGFTESVLAFSSLFLFPFYMFPGMYYAGKKGKEGFIK
jgi:hypothetical protein